ncbi:MAG TPA: hypothetical protein P5084_09185 [Paludibacter sp.]|nr:hypothetical protein [Paludibacter sp.]
MNNNSTIQEKREYLKKISQPLTELKESGAIESINAGLKAIYSAQGHEVLKTFEQWTSAGYRVKQGAKALYLWGKQTARTITEEGEEKEIKFFPLVALFSDLQVYNPDNNK